MGIVILLRSSTLHRLYIAEIEESAHLTRSGRPLVAARNVHAELGRRVVIEDHDHTTLIYLDHGTFKPDDPIASVVSANTDPLPAMIGASQGALAH